MALGYLIDPAFQSVNENGRPLVGGHIEVYYHNTQEKYITKADFDGTNNPFKVPLNSKGMAVLIADDSNAYDVFCYDAFNALFWSRENVVISGSGAGITEIVFFDYETATYDDISLADGFGKLIVLKEVINMFNVAYAQMQYSVPLGSYVFTNIYGNNLTTYTIALDGTKTKQTIPIGGGESNVEIFRCTEPNWPNPTEMFDSYNGGKDVVIVRKSLAGINYFVWRLESVVKDSGLVENYTLEFQNEEGSSTADHKEKRVKFYSTDYENWTITENTFYYPERATIAPNWSSLDVSNYRKGTLVYYEGVLYRCNTNSPSVSWVDAEWEETDVAKEIVSDSNIDMDFLRPVFVQQLTTDDNDLNFDARLENLLYKLPSGYKKVRGVYNISNATLHQIDTGISTDDGIDIELITAFFINSWVQYGQIIGNTYMSDSAHYFSVSCGASSGTINCFANTNYLSIPNITYQNGSAICLRQMGVDRIAKDCYYPFTSYLANNTSGDANTSNIVMFGGPLVTIYSLYIKKGGEVVRDFIPCVRLSDNVAGFYDKISKSFFTNDDPSIIGVSYP